MTDISQRRANPRADVVRKFGQVRLNKVACTECGARFVGPSFLYCSTECREGAEVRSALRRGLPCDHCRVVFSNRSFWLTQNQFDAYCSVECRDADEVRKALTPDPTLIVTGVDHSGGSSQSMNTLITLRSVDGKVEVVDLHEFRGDIKPGSKIKMPR